MDDLDLVEGVAETIRSSVQLQLAWGLESVRSWGGGPFLVMRLWGSCNMIVVLRNWSRLLVAIVVNWSWLLVVIVVNRSWLLVIVVNWSWLMLIVMGWGWSMSYGSWSRTRVLLAESWVVPAWIVLSILKSLVIIAAALVVKIGLILWLRLMGSRSWRWWPSWGYRQMISRGLESKMCNPFLAFLPSI